MRVISQDGTTDIPYESSLIVRINEKICAVNQSIPGKIALAAYSTESNAINAMKMLHTEYKRIQTTTNKSSFYFAIDYPKVFQFPEDEDVEV